MHHWHSGQPPLPYLGVLRDAFEVCQTPVGVSEVQEPVALSSLP
jgi:hypothetical protein